jgi:hypothetical protein
MKTLIEFKARMLKIEDVEYFTQNLQSRIKQNKKGV